MLAKRGKCRLASQTRTHLPKDTQKTPLRLVCIILAWLRKSITKKIGKVNRRKQPKMAKRGRAGIC